MKPDPIKPSYHSAPPLRRAHDEHDLLLSVERAGRHNRRSSRDRLRWDRELWDAYLRGSAARPSTDHSDAA